MLHNYIDDYLNLKKNFLDKQIFPILYQNIHQRKKNKESDDFIVIVLTGYAYSFYHSTIKKSQ